MVHKVQFDGHLLVTTTQEDNLVPDPDTRSGRLLPPWVPARAHLMPPRGMNVDPDRGAMAGDQGQTSAPQGLAVAGEG